ncbi:hypothetical protein [Streptomyces sp. NPDC059003]|uniref:hypothetical protein n=1 Tax=Streptomyces sp. NPDC059003 TaxID=3346691 RepID=UPI0036A76F82
MDGQELPRYATEPEAVIVETVRRLEPGLDAHEVEAVLVAAISKRPQRRDLARVLQADPALLTSGRPEGPRTVERLIRALREQGAQRLELPRCGDCHKDRPLVGVGDGLRICSRCQGRRLNHANPCAICGIKDFAARDREGRPRCRNHPPDAGRDPLEAMVTLIEALSVGLERRLICEAVRSVERRRNGQRRLLWALEDIPDLLKGRGALGPPKTAALAQALVDRGAVDVTVPACPICHRTVRLEVPGEGMRCCTECWHASRPQTCVRCGRSRPVGGRTHDGAPLCRSCIHTDPFNHRACVRCGAVRIMVERTEHGGLCGRCRQLPQSVCSVCGRTAPCHFAKSSVPLCEPCSEMAKPREVCAGCGAARRVNSRTAEGRPLCGHCGQKPVPCSGCGKLYRVSSRSPDGEPLCATCWSKHPAARRPCTECGTVDKPYHQGRCITCVARERLHRVLTGSRHSMRPEIEPVFTALLRTRPGSLLRWIRPASARHMILTTLAEGNGPITHDSLDTFQPSVTIRHLRAALVAGGALPARDELLAQLEACLPKILARVEAPDERQILRMYLTWGPLRRLRQRSATQAVTYAQTVGVRHEIKTAVRYLHWLHQQGSTLGECTQDHLDTWLDEGAHHRTLIRSFLLWTSRRGHTRPLEAPAYTNDFGQEVIAQDHRWNLVRRLIHDDSLDTVDRAAGLLLLLFAQPTSRIAQLTTHQVTDQGDLVALQLGREPVILPPPLDGFIRHLVGRRQGRAVTTPLDESPWLFPGAYPGQPLTSYSLAARLKALGIRCQVARRSALIEIASELPAYVISRLLGFHQHTADQWQRDNQGYGAAYAAELTRR